MTAPIALVTGASRGIGQGIAVALAAAGYRVLGTATGDGGIAAITTALAPYGDSHRALLLDVSTPAAISEFCEMLAREELAPAVLVNNAGVTRDNLLIRMKDAEWQQVMDTNLSAVFHLCRGLVRSMLKARYGRIINLTSVVGVTGNAGQANYAAAKAGLLGFTKSLAQELAARSITVNAIAPGLIDTDMTRALDAALRDKVLAQIPAGRFGTVEDIAALAVYLASPAAAYVTGQTIHVNGGMHMV
jgi:3-oxoacyl-[acyl-carrier protein] reductase